MKLFKPNLKLTVFAGVVWLLMSIGNYGGSGSQEAQTAAKVKPQKGHECEMGNFDECSEQCELRNGDSCSNLGIMYVNGIGVERDELKAGQLYQQACDLESADGCYALYSALLYGVGMRTDRSQALKVADKACRLGHDKSCSIVKMHQSLGL